MSNDVDNSRRAFLRGAFLTREGRDGYEQQNRSLGPPPPWHQGKIDPERCLNCDAPCVSACEPGIIKRHSSDHSLAGVPYLNFSETGCTFCGQCVSACPMELNSEVAPPKIGHVQLALHACLAWNNVFCMSCRGQCDHDALTLDPRRRMHLDEDACTGCGRCISVCPENALSFKS